MTKQYLLHLIQRFAGISLVSILCTSASVAQFQDGFYSDFLEFADLLVPDGTQVTLGIGPEYRPDYFGSNEYDLDPGVAFLVRLGDVFTIGNDGAALNILGLKDIEFGPVVRATGGRKASKNLALTGLGNISTSLDLGVYAKLSVSDYFSARIRYYHAVINSGNGGLIDLTLNRLLYRKKHFSVAMGIRGSWAQKSRAEQFFGISTEQSNNSGLPEYSTGASFQDVRVNFGARWEFSENWSLNGFVRYTRLLGDIADSPIVNPLGSPDQFAVGSFVAYTFSID